MTPPPDIDLVSWQTSVQKMSDWTPKRLVLTHFGRVDEPAAHIARFTSRLNAWSERARELWLASSDARTAAALFGGERLDEIRSSVDQSNVSRYERSEERSVGKRGEEVGGEREGEGNARGGDRMTEN